MADPRLPLLVRCLLRLAPVPGDRRADVQADLQELFAARRCDRGPLYAHWRLYHDIASLWVQRRPMTRTTASRSALAFLHDAAADLRYAARLFKRQPAILLLTVVGLSLGLAIATAAFSIMNAAALRGEGLADPDRAPGVLRTTDRSVSTTWSYEEFVRLREGATKMQVEAVHPGAALVRTGEAVGDAPSVSIAFVSGGFFAATGGRMARGRPLGPADDQASGQMPAVVSFVFWTSRLNRDPAVIGRTIRIGRTEATIVGVAERGFSVPNNRLLWMPLTAYGRVYVPGSATRAPETGLQVFGRLLPNVTLSEAEAQLSGVAAALPGGSATGDSVLRVRLDPHAGLGRVSSAQAMGAALFVFAVIGLVLLLACANVAMVLVATAITREREIGVRAALGASRGRIVRQLVTESVALGALAAAVGMMFASWAIPVIAGLIDAPAGTDLAPDVNVFLFLAIVTLLTSVGAGLAPAWHGRGVDLLSPLKGEGRQNRIAPRRLRSMLIMTQSAASVLLIVLATLFVRATFRAAAVDVGFEAAGLFAISAGLGDPFAGSGAAIERFWPRAISALQGAPGIQGVTLAEPTPFGELSKTWTTRGEPPRVINLYGTQAAYFETMGLRILGGRTYTADEVAAKAPVAVVSESFARAYWPNQSAVGELLPRTSVPRPVVIGVVADAITARLHERNGFAVYEPLAPDNERYAQLLVRVEPGASDVMEQVSQRLRALDPDAEITIRSIAARVQQEAGRPRMLATLTGMVGLIAIVLCVIGLYGLTASVVGQRSREMAVRAAIGAESRDLLRLLMWDSLRPVVLGLAAGGAAALLVSRVAVSAMLFGVSPQDPTAYAGAAAILLLSATLAVVVPTRRAAAVDAASVLRQS